MWVWDRIKIYILMLNSIWSKVKSRFTRLVCVSGCVTCVFTFQLIKNFVKQNVFTYFFSIIFQFFFLLNIPSLYVFLLKLYVVFKGCHIKSTKILSFSVNRIFFSQNVKKMKRNYNIFKILMKIRANF